MEAEVLQSQVDADEEDVNRLHREIQVSREELARGWPRLADAEAMASGLSKSISDMETTHTDEIAMLRSVHSDDMSELGRKHDLQITELEHAKLGEEGMTALGLEDLQKLQSEIDEIRWQGEVYIREQQDAIRESCMRQRENTRLSKRHGEARQEALELAVKLEAMRAADAGAPAREAELHIVRQRCALLQRTASEFKEALARKSEDCIRWRQKAIQQGSAAMGGEDVGSRPAPLSPSGNHSSGGYASSVPALKSPSNGVPPSFGGSASSQIPAFNWHNLSSPPVLGDPVHGQELWLGVPTPTRTQHHGSSEFVGSTSLQESQQAHELLAAALHAAEVWAEAVTVSGGSSAYPRGTATGDTVRELPPGIEPHSMLGTALVDAENELEMLTFLLDEGASLIAEVLLEQEAHHQPPLVAKRLQEHLHELSMRRRSL
jgi:hypothetical protein